MAAPFCTMVSSSQSFAAGNLFDSSQTTGLVVVVAPEFQLCAFIPRTDQAWRSAAVISLQSSLSQSQTFLRVRIDWPLPASATVPAYGGADASIRARPVRSSAPAHTERSDRTNIFMANLVCWCRIGAE